MIPEHETEKWLDETLERIGKKMVLVRERSKNKIPATCINGVHDDRSDQSRCWGEDDGLNWWTNGFWAGLLWQLYHYTKDERYAEIAKKTEAKLDTCFLDFYGLHHDVGFMWLPSAVADYKLTTDADAKRRALLAAQLLAGRYNPVGKYIRAWNDNIPGQTESNSGWVIIDSMFNISLLFWASEVSGDPRFRQIAVMHADTVADNFIRENGSSKHIVVFDPQTGKAVKELGGQGYAEGSAWTRGQGWALYGFANAFRHTGKQSYLDTAQKTADYFIAHIPENGLIPVDFNQPAEPWIEDSTAAAIAAGGLLELAAMIPEKEQQYRTAAIRLLKKLSEIRCDFSPETDGLLTHCTSAYHSTVGREVNLTYADYYYVEALLKLKGKDFRLW